MWAGFFYEKTRIIIFFCAYSILTEGVLLPQLFSSALIPVWRFVWFTTGGCFLSDISVYVDEYSHRARNEKKTIFRIFCIYHFMRYFEFAHKGKCKMKKSLKIFVISSVNFISETAQPILIKFRIADVKCFRCILFYLISVHMPPTVVEFCYS